MNKATILACLLGVCSSPAHAQSFGMDKINEVNQYAASQGAYVPNYNYEPIPAPTVYMGNGTYMTPDGPMQDMGGGVIMMPNGEAIGTTVNDVPYSRFPAY
jgi:hypothetical protein